MQEHHLLDFGDRKHSNTNKILKAFGKNHDMYIKPAKKSDNNVSRGRPSGGLVTMWRKELTQYVSQAKCDNFRLQGTIFSLSESNKIMFLNTYFMCTPNTDNFDDDELMKLLNDIKLLTLSSEGISKYLILGDLNVDFSRNNRFTRIIKTFFDDFGSVIFWSNPDDTPGHFIQQVPYTHEYIREGVKKLKGI